jgi:enoyl-CoA hydratase/carnithine racemase
VARVAASRKVEAPPTATQKMTIPKEPGPGAGVAHGDCSGATRYTDDMNQESVLEQTTHGKGRVLSFNRPERLNAFNSQLYNDVCDALDAASADDGISVVVLTGNGRAFSAGADRSGTEPRPGIAFDRFLETVGSTFPKPLIAAVNGVAVGIGVTMLPLCDLVLIDADARLRMPFTELGVAPEAGSSGLLPALIGSQQAARLFLTSDWMTAEQAVSLGLGLQVCAPGTVVQEALALATRIAEFSLKSLIATKRTLLASRAETFRNARAAETEVWADLKVPPR